MTWAKFTDDFPTHPKIVDLSDAAFRLHVTAVCYSSAHLLNGRLTDSLPFVFARGSARKTRPTITELVEKGVWDRTEDGYEIHDYLVYQPSKETVLERRKKAGQRVSALRARKSGNASGNGVTNGGGNAASNGDSNASPTRPDPTPSSVGSSNDSHTRPDKVPVADAPAEEDQDFPTRLEAAVWHHIGLCLIRLADPPARQPDRYLTSVIPGLRDIHGERIRAACANIDPGTNLELDQIAVDIAEAVDPQWGPLDGGRARADRRQTEQAQHWAEKDAHAAAVDRERALIDDAIEAMAPGEWDRRLATAAAQLVLRPDTIRPDLAIKSRARVDLLDELEADSLHPSNPQKTSVASLPQGDTP